MRYVVNSNNYVVAISFGTDMIYNDCVCTEYTGRVPSGWNSLEEWHEDEGEKLWRWKIVSGNLTLDSKAKAPDEGRWGAPKLEELKIMPASYAQNRSPSQGFDGFSKVTVYGDTDLASANVVSGKSIFGVVGTARVGLRLSGTASVHSSSIVFDLDSSVEELPPYITLFRWEDDLIHSGEDGCNSITSLDIQSGTSGVYKIIGSEDYYPGLFTVYFPDTSNKNKIAIAAANGTSFSGRYIGLALYS